MMLSSKDNEIESLKGIIRSKEESYLIALDARILEIDNLRAAKNLEIDNLKMSKNAQYGKLRNVILRWKLQK
eukprot:UN02319